MPGKIVETASGKGKTNDADKPFGKKIVVTLDKGGNILCDPKKIKVIGFWD